MWIEDRVCQLALMIASVILRLRVCIKKSNFFIEDCVQMLEKYDLKRSFSIQFSIYDDIHLFDSAESEN